MKRRYFSIAAAFLTISALEPAFGHDQAGGLGDTPSATDLFLISCFDDGAGRPDRMFFQVSNEGRVTDPIPSALVQVPDRRMAYSLTVPRGVRSSRGVEVRGGDAPYFVTVAKNGAGRAAFSFEFHCETADSAHTGTSIVQRQNQ